MSHKTGERVRFITCTVTNETLNQFRFELLPLTARHTRTLVFISDFPKIAPHRRVPFAPQERENFEASTFWEVVVILTTPERLNKPNKDGIPRLLFGNDMAMGTESRDLWLPMQWYTTRLNMIFILSRTLFHVGCSLFESYRAK
jgi:hypothetical protein